MSLGMFAARLVQGGTLHVVSTEDGSVCTLAFEQYISLPDDVADKLWWSFDLGEALKYAQRIRARLAVRS